MDVGVGDEVMRRGNKGLLYKDHTTLHLVMADWVLLHTNAWCPTQACINIT